jgi:hypothetical protein
MMVDEKRISYSSGKPFDCSHYLKEGDPHANPR